MGPCWCLEAACLPLDERADASRENPSKAAARGGGGVGTCACGIKSRPSATQDRNNSLGHHLSTLIRGDKELKKAGWVLHKGAPQPGPLLSFVQENGGGPGAAASGLQRTFETRTFHHKQSLELGVWSLQGDRAGEGCVYLTKGTLCLLTVELTLHSSSGMGGGLGGGGFKDDMNHISQSTKESPR